MYLYEQPAPSGRLAGITFVLLLHAITVYALVTGPAPAVVESLPPPIETRLLDEPEPPAEPLSRLSPQLVMPARPDLPLPEIQLRQPAPANVRVPAIPVAAVTRAKPPEQAALAPAAAALPARLPEPARVSPHIEVGKTCVVPDYPPASKAAGEAGTVALRFLVDPDGRVAESQIESSSGFPRLDEAARAALSLCQFTAGTADGKPERSWARLRYVWKLR